MADQDVRDPEGEEVEGHLLKEALATGAAAGALLAGAGPAAAQLPPGDGGASAGARAPGYVVDPGQGGGAGKLEPGPSAATGAKAKPGKKAPAKKRAGR